MAEKRNMHTRLGFNKQNPETAIHLGPNRHITIDDALQENASDNKKVGNREYNDQRYLRNRIEVTHAQLLSLASENQVQPGRAYLITDFETRQSLAWIEGDDYIAPVEPLVVLGLTENTFDKRAVSTLFPQDIIEYDPFVLNDSFTPLKGRINYRKDPVLNIETLYDFRNCRKRLYKIIGKQKEVPTSISATEIDLELTFSPSLNANYMNVYRKWDIQFPNEFTHDAGELTITVRKGAFSFTRPLLKRDGTANWDENELAGLTGPLVNCNVREAFVLMYGVDTGEQLIGEYIATNNTPPTEFVRGNNVRFIVDPEDYEDYLTFQIDGYNRDIKIMSRPNNVFKGQARNIFLGPTCDNNVVRGNCNSIFFPRHVGNNIFDSINWSNIMGFTQQNLFLTSTSYFISTGQDQVVNNTFVLGQFGTHLEAGASNNTIITNNHWFLNVQNLPIEFSGMFFFTGSGGDTHRSGITLMRGARSSLIGGFTPTKGTGVNGFTEHRWLNNTSLFEEQESLNTFQSIAIKNPISPPVGTTKLVGIDSKGNLVELDFVFDPETGLGTGVEIVSVPENPNSPGEVGQFAFGSGFVYMAKDTNSWSRWTEDESTWNNS